MPNLRILGQKSFFAGDDIRVPLFLGAVFRLIEVSFSLPLLIHVVSSPTVEQTFLLTVEACILDLDDKVNATAIENVHAITIVYAAGSLAVALAGVLNYAIMFVTAGRGNPTNTEPRRYMSLYCGIDFTIILGLRVCILVFGLFLGTVFTDYCQCEYQQQMETDGGYAGDGRVLSKFSDFKEQCWMFQSAWKVAYLGLMVCQAMDIVWGMIHYTSLLCHIFPTKAFISAETAWHCCCQFCVSCVNCMTCCSMGGLEAIGSSDTAEFANICSNFFGNGNILDIAFSDILAGLFVTRLIHYTIEISVTKEMISKGLAEALVNEEVDHAVGQIASIRDAVKSKLSNEGLVPPCTERVVERVTKLDGAFLHELTTNVNSAESVQRVDDENDHASGDSYNDVDPNIQREESFSPGVQQIAGIEAKILEANQFLVPLLNTKLSSKNKDEVSLLREGARYISFASSIYDWSVKDVDAWYDWGRASKKTYVEHSDHAGKAMQVSPIFSVKEEDMVYANYKAGIVATPFAVVLDHAWKSVIVAIRGSASINDFICDLAFSRCSLDDYGIKYGFDGKDKFAHKGMLDCAEWITKDLLDVQILDRLLLNENAPYQHYQLRVVGHSLGAAAASLVSLFLRSRFPDVKAVVYEPPGCTMSSDLAEESKQWCTSFVTGMDVIPRFASEAMNDLRLEILINLARIRVPKHVIMANRYVDRHGIDAVKEFLSRALYAYENIPETAFLESVKELYLSSISRLEASRNGGLHLPGRIIHLTSVFPTMKENIEAMVHMISPESEDARNGGKDGNKLSIGNYQTCWANREDFRHIILSNHFIEDHLTATIERAFSDRMQMLGLQPPYCH